MGTTATTSPSARARRVVLPLALALGGCDALEDEPAGTVAAPAGVAADPVPSTPDAGTADAFAPGPMSANAPVRAPAAPAGEPSPGTAPPGGSVAPVADTAAGPAALDSAADTVPAATAPSPVSPTAPVVPPDATTDCAATLPCRLRSPDGAFELTLTRAGGEAIDGTGGVTVDVALRAITRDLTLDVETTSSVTSDGVTARVADVRTDTPGQARAPAYALRPGTPANAAIRFGLVHGAVPDAPGRVDLAVREADVVHRLAFANVPFGPAAAPAVDCALTLPCTWSSADGATTLRIDAIGLERWHHAPRLIVDWTLAAVAGREVTLADGARALTDTDRELEYYGIDFGAATSRGEGPLSDTPAADGSVAGRTVFRRPPPVDATFLAPLEIVFVERADSGTPGHRAVLTRLPLAP